MKVLLTAHQFFPKHYTGTERFILNLSKQLQRMGHYVKVLTFETSENDGSMQQVGDFLYREYEFQGIPVISVRHRKIPDVINFSIFDQNMERMFETLFSNWNFDIIHLGHPMRIGTLINVAKRRKIPVVLTLTDFWLMCALGIAVTKNGDLCNFPDGGIKCAKECFKIEGKERMVQRFNDANDYIKKVDFMAAPTYFLAGLMKNVFNRDINVVRHGTDYFNITPNKRQKQENDEVIFGYIGTILRHKGIHIVANALKLLKNKNIRIKIYGNCSLDPEYYETLKKLTGGDSRIEFLGEYKDEEMQTIMNGVDCILAPSTWWENSPLTVLTGLAYKVPVITINIGGAAELIKDGVNGFNFKIGDPNSLANIMGKILENPAILNGIKANIIRPPRVEEEAFEYEKIYSKLLKR